MNIGIARRDITPQAPMELLGYGDRDHKSEGIHDPLSVYVLYIEQPDGQPLAWFSADLCIFGPDCAKALKQRIAKATGVDAQAMHLQGTHTHSGPDVYALHIATGAVEKAYFELLAARFSEALKEAVKHKHAATLELREGIGTIGVNRRGLDKPIDRRVFLLDIVDDKGKRSASVMYYSCHLTALGVENYLVSSDWIGPVRNWYEQDNGFPLMFVQGAEGNVDPWTRGVLDMSDPDQAKGVSFEMVEQIAAKFYRDLKTIRATEAINTIEAVKTTSFEASFPLLFGAMDAAGLQKKVDDWKHEFATFLGIPVSEVPEDGSINNLIKKRAVEIGSSPEQTEHLVINQFTYTQFLWAYGANKDYIDMQKGTIRIPIVVVDFGVLAIVGLPVEPLMDFNLDFQHKVTESQVVVAGLVDGYFGYLPHRHNFAEQKAEALYETISTVFAPETAEMIIDEVVDVLKQGGRR